MSEKTVTIGVERMHCADCLATLSDVVLPRMPGVVSTSVSGTDLVVVVDEDSLTEDGLLSALTDAGLLK